MSRLLLSPKKVLFALSCNNSKALYSLLLEEQDLEASRLSAWEKVCSAGGDHTSTNVLEGN